MYRIFITIEKNVIKENKKVDKLEVVDLYENANKTKIDEFTNKTNSTLKVNIDKKRKVKEFGWIEMMAFTIPYLDNILRKPNRFIVNEEEIVKIEQAKKVSVETIKHLSKNTNFIQTVDKETGDVTPSKLLNVRKEETYNTYENRLVFTLIQNMNRFIKKKKENLTKISPESENNTEEKDNKMLEYSATSTVEDEQIEVNLSLNSKLVPNSGKDTEELSTIIAQIDEIEKKIQGLQSTEVYKTLAKEHVLEVREPVKKTNVILKNVNFQYAMKLWDYLRDNFEDKDTSTEEQKDYIDNGNLKKMVDETFLLHYLTMQTLDNDDIEEKKDTKEEMQKNVVDQMIDKMLEINENLSEEQIKNLIAAKYEVVKYKKLAVIQEIQKIFRDHIKSYMKRIGNREETEE